MHYLLLVALPLMLLVSLTTTRAADGVVTTVADSDACNVEAPTATLEGTPRAGAMTTNSIDFTGNVIESPDPQVHGMETQGAKDPTYQAAYRRCMRRKGF